METSKSLLNVICGLFLLTILLAFMPSEAQGHHHGHGKDRGGRRVRPAVKVVAFSRTKRVIVRPRVVRTIRVLPTGCRTFVHNRNNYYAHNGLYYGLRNNAYVVMPAPFGIRVNILPVGYRNVHWGNANYYYHRGAYYNRVESTNEYEVIEPKVGMVVPELPEDDVEEVQINDQTYYEYDNYLYKQIPTKSGLQYEVVGTLEDK